jgi:putative transcriptional regulator
LLTLALPPRYTRDMNTHMIQPKLSQVLEVQGKSLYWLAQETGVAYSTLHKFNKAQTKGIDFRVLDEICAALSCQPGDILIRLPNGAAKKAAKKKGAK